MTKIVKEFEVKAPPERVFGLVSVPEKWCKWHTNVKAATSNGSEAHWVYGWGGMKVESNTEVTQSEENRVYAFRQTNGFFKTAQTRLEIKPTKKGSAITWTVEYQLPYSFLGKLVDKLKASKELEVGMGKSFENLRQLAER